MRKEGTITGLDRAALAVHAVVLDDEPETRRLLGTARAPGFQRTEPRTIQSPALRPDSGARTMASRKNVTPPSAK